MLLRCGCFGRTWRTVGSQPPLEKRPIQTSWFCSQMISQQPGVLYYRDSTIYGSEKRLVANLESFQVELGKRATKVYSKWGPRFLSTLTPQWRQESCAASWSSWGKFKVKRVPNVSASILHSPAADPMAMYTLFSSASTWKLGLPQTLLYMPMHLSSEAKPVASCLIQQVNHLWQQRWEPACTHPSLKLHRVATQGSLL